MKEKKVLARNSHKRIKTEANKFFVSTTDGATGVGIAAVSIFDKLDKEHCIRGHFSARIIFTLIMVYIFLSHWVVYTKDFCVFTEL